MARRRWSTDLLSLPALAVCLILGVAACGTDGGDGGKETGTSALGKGDQYVALGDSFTSAPGTGAPVGPAACERTSVNYPHLVAGSTGVDLVDNSCGSASTLALTQPQTFGGGTPPQPPQLDALSSETDLVTIRIGGADHGLYRRIAQCMDAGLAADPGAPCTEADAAATYPVAAALETLAATLRDVLEAVVTRAPEAEVLVVGYPQFVPPDDGTCDLFPMAAGDHPWARSIVEGWNRALSVAAATVHATYVDVAAVSAGHDVCADEPWVAGYPESLGEAAPLHPYPVEQRAVADLVLAEIED